VLVHK